MRVSAVKDINGRKVKLNDRVLHVELGMCTVRYDHDYFWLDSDDGWRTGLAPDTEPESKHQRHRGTSTDIEVL